MVTSATSAQARCRDGGRMGPDPGGAGAAGAGAPCPSMTRLVDGFFARFPGYLSEALAEAPHDGTPVVLETERALSLHFDLHATQSLMSRRDPNALVLGYTRAMMGFLLLHPEPARIGRISLIGLGAVRWPSIAITTCWGQGGGGRDRPAVIALRETFHIPPDGERFEVVLRRWRRLRRAGRRVRT